MGYMVSVRIKDKELRERAKRYAKEKWLTIDSLIAEAKIRSFIPL
ncbi:MAG: hypothetical protein ACUVTD_06515 [Nitrososphaerales archaeon]